MVSPRTAPATLPSDVRPAEIFARRALLSDIFFGRSVAFGALASVLGIAAGSIYGLIMAPNPGGSAKKIEPSETRAPAYSKVSKKLLDSAIVALITALFVYGVLAEARARRKALLQHLRNVAELNLEIRSALQIIVDSKNLAPQQQAETKLEGVNRIAKALRDLLPAIRRGGFYAQASKSDREIRP